MLKLKTILKLIGFISTFLVIFVLQWQSPKINNEVAEDIGKCLYKSNYNNERPHSGKYCYGKTPMQTFEDSKKLAVEKNNEILYLEYSSDSHNLSDIQI